jgi:rare lipoprotein A
MGRSTRNRRLAAAAAVAGAILVGAAATLPTGGEMEEAPAPAVGPDLATPVEPGPDREAGPVVDPPFDADESATTTATTAAAAAEPTERVVVRTLEGVASFYASSLAGRRTASGVPYRPREMVAAHRDLPFGTRLRVENLRNGRVVEVTVVDRGPFTRGRVLDLSRRAAEELDFVRQGHTRVRIEVLGDAGAPAVD